MSEDTSNNTPGLPTENNDIDSSAEAILNNWKAQELPENDDQEATTKSGETTEEVEEID